MTNRDVTPVKIIRARANGILIPVRAARASMRADIPYAVACAFLEQESAGGMNVFGHDPGNYCGAGEVTRAKYLDYRTRRKAGQGMQGVGPMQLTWWELQDQADEAGGCWRPFYNMLVGFQTLAGYFEVEGNWRDAARRYNGSGPAAEAYADQVAERIAKWRELLR